ncbi:predicted protein [Lichtheimia corymbifera JMRC:FSU:9682]|uniref:Uncharacterized protein n=1 Tax=Lichtheimia corymbifera JMRC:FSU:9682 TaxID=1263082 RepID=A0A068SDH7_9FUNG|nr:predicted protein [Lichtheimia corymbifera JMRC:FSU:9682]
MSGSSISSARKSLLIHMGYQSLYMVDNHIYSFLAISPHLKLAASTRSFYSMLVEKKGAIIKWPSIDSFRKAIVTKDVTTDPWYIVFPDVFHHTVDPGIGSSRSVPKTPADSYYISSEESDTEEVLDWTTSS